MKEYTVKVYKDRTEWRLNGELHREDGPAIEWINGTKSWWHNGERHRDDGPACEYAEGIVLWYLNGKQLTRKEHQETMKRRELIDAIPICDTWE